MKGWRVSLSALSMLALAWASYLVVRVHNGASASWEAIEDTATPTVIEIPRLGREVIG